MQINVNKPFLPPKSAYIKLLDSIWQSNHLTNFGPLATRLEERLSEYLGVENLLFVANGTLALQIAYRILGLERGERVLTTPFSFVATTSTALWEGLEPVFCDIDESFCVDSEILRRAAKKHEAGAILAVHTFGNAADLDALEKIAAKRKLKLIFDAAHAFGVRYRGRSIFGYGDAATLSFHATKIFHTIEGGAIIFKDAAALKEARAMINFGLKNNLPEILGINAKNSEFHAAMGLCVLDEMPRILEEREKIWRFYFENLAPYFQMQKQNPLATQNFHYFPIVFESESSLFAALARLNEAGIFPRRYFYPSLDSLDFSNKKSHAGRKKTAKDSRKNAAKFAAKICPNSAKIAARILCLPMFVGLDLDSQKRIVEILLKG